MALLTLDQIDKIDIIDFLASLGSRPTRIVGPHYWYHSMLSGGQKNKAHFHVNRRTNRWYDLGIGAGSTLTDFGIRYFRCTRDELAQKIASYLDDRGNVLQALPANPVKTAPKIKVLETYPVRSQYLVQYLWERRIPLMVARQYCVEVIYTLDEKPGYAIGFPCDDGGYILRDKFRYHIADPVSATHITRGSNAIAVFQDFPDMLTLEAFLPYPANHRPDFLVLNHPDCISTAVALLKSYSAVHLLFTNSTTGEELSRLAREQRSGCLDHRSLYKRYPSLNQWVCNIGKPDIRLPGDGSTTYPGTS